VKSSSSEDNNQMNDDQEIKKKKTKKIIFEELVTQNNKPSKHQKYVHLMDKPLEKILIRYSNTFLCSESECFKILFISLKDMSGFLQNSLLSYFLMAPNLLLL